MSVRNKRASSLRRNHRQTEDRLAKREARRVQVAFTAAQVDAPGRTEGRRWIAELVDAAGVATVPLCVAWLTDYTPAMPMCLDFLIVPFESDRRLGYGTRMIEECRKRWPQLMYTDPVTRQGEGFYETLPDFGLDEGPYSLDGPPARSDGDTPGG